MTLPAEITTVAITLTPAAARAVQKIITQKNLSGYGLRLYVSGGGCSGYQYGLALDNRDRDEDTVFETEGIKLLVDEVSIKYLHGATVDYVEDETASGFKIINPNAMPSCSCGQASDSPEAGASDTCEGCA